MFSNVGLLQHTFKSDHFPLTFCTKCDINTKPVYKERYEYDFSRANFDSINDVLHQWDLSNLLAACNTVESAWDVWLSRVHLVIKDNVPVFTVHNTPTRLGLLN